MAGELVLVTGGSGFVGAHCIVALLEGGYRVRTTVRSLTREAEVRTMLKRGGADPGERLSFVEADLTEDRSWADAVRGCQYALHVASPFPLGVPDREEDLIVPAREGTLRVLRASRDAGVRRVVLTSSFAAIGYGHGPRDTAFDETDWTDLNGRKVSTYAKSKTVAERAAWDFVEREGGSLELAVVNPVAVFGPVLGPDVSTSIQIIKMLLTGAVPSVPRLSMGVVDVRDVADLQLRAMTHPDAKGERFIANAGDFATTADFIRILKANLGSQAARVPTRTAPDWLVRLAALFNPAIATVLPEIGRKKNAGNEKARKMLGWSPRSVEDAILATAHSLIDLGLLDDGR